MDNFTLQIVSLRKIFTTGTTVTNFAGIAYLTQCKIYG